MIKIEFDNPMHRSTIIVKESFKEITKQLHAIEDGDIGFLILTEVDGTRENQECLITLSPKMISKLKFIEEEDLNEI